MRASTGSPMLPNAHPCALLAGDSFQPLLLELFGQAWFTSRTAIITGVGCCAMLPLCFRTRLGALKCGLLGSRAGCWLVPARAGRCLH